IVRIFNTYGPRMRLNDGRVLPAFIGQALRGEDLTVFGDGSQTRSFCYVDDQVEGIYRLLHSDYPHPVNIGNPDEITIKQFGEEIIKLTGTTQKLVYRDLPADDPKQRRPDITKARELLGWEPQVGRAEGLRITYDYFRSLLDQELKHEVVTYYNKKQMSTRWGTGGTAYIGADTVVELQHAGYTPVIVDNLSNSNVGVLDHIEKITGSKPEFHNFD